MGFNTQKVYKDEEPYFSMRKQMVRRQIAARDVHDARVLRVMEEIPRHLFVEESLRNRAYDDCPLPIAHGQTISQPYIVAKIAELAQLSGREKVLEIGAGCGYQAVVLGRLAKEVVAVEWHPGLATFAVDTVHGLGVNNVRVIQGDGKLGWKPSAPYDRIVVSCASRSIQPAWEEQLRKGGLLIVPIVENEEQVLYRFVKGEQGLEEGTPLFGVRFVPLL